LRPVGDDLILRQNGETLLRHVRDKSPSSDGAFGARAPVRSVIADNSSGISGLLAGRHLPALDGLRACAVLVVMMYHFGFSAVPGYLGVSAFFVLSGFLITWLLLKEFDRSGTVSLRDFYMRRFLRIFPAYYVFLAVSLGLDYVRHDPRVRDIALPGIAYLMNYYNAFHGHPPTSIAHAWSLAIEEQFYLVWPALFLVIARRPRREALAIISGLVLVFAGWRSFLFLTGTAGPAYVYNAFDTRADILAIGCLLAFASRSVSFQRWSGKLGRWGGLPLITVALLLLSRMRGSEAYHYSVGFTVDALLLALFIIQVLQLHQRALWRWLDYRPVRYAGAISYPLYLYHILAYGAARKLVPAGPVFVRDGAAIGISLILASVSYYVVERRFMRLKTRFSPSGNATTVPSWPTVAAP